MNFIPLIGNHISIEHSIEQLHLLLHHLFRTLYYRDAASLREGRGEGAEGKKNVHRYGQLNGKDLLKVFILIGSVHYLVMRTYYYTGVFITLYLLYF